jgi:hypothetical protein
MMKDPCRFSNEESLFEYRLRPGRTTGHPEAIL